MAFTKSLAEMEQSVPESSTREKIKNLFDEDGFTELDKFLSADGEVSSVLATLDTEEAAVTKVKADRAEALANMKNIPFRVKVFDENGKLDYKVRVNTADVKADTTLCAGVICCSISACICT